MRSRLVLAGLVALLGCRGGEPQTAPHTVPTSPSGSAPSGAAMSSGSGADPWKPTPAATDPWAVTDVRSADAPPTMDERKQLADEACPSVTGPYFFRVEKGGKVSHLLGTRHVSVSLAKFPKAVHDALDAAKLVVFEVAPDDKTGFDAPEIDLRSELGATTWMHYQELVGTDVARALEHAAPATALISMMVMYEYPMAMLERDIEQKATTVRTPMSGLETSAFQDGVITKILDLRMARESITHTKDRKELEDHSRKDLAEYCAGTDDTPGLDDEDRAEMLASGYTKAELDEYDETMVYRRNASWIPQLEKLFRTPGVFVAVGAAHLQGPRGVVALLAAKGYKVTRVK